MSGECSEQWRIQWLQLVEREVLLQLRLILAPFFLGLDLAFWLIPRNDLIGSIGQICVLKGVVALVVISEDLANRLDAGPVGIKSPSCSQLLEFLDCIGVILIELLDSVQGL